MDCAGLTDGAYVTPASSRYETTEGASAPRRFARSRSHLRRPINFPGNRCKGRAYRLARFEQSFDGGPREV